MRDNQVRKKPTQGEEGHGLLEWGGTASVGGYFGCKEQDNSTRGPNSLEMPLSENTQTKRGFSGIH